MASLQQIEFALLSINEVVFQELCDDYLRWSEEESPELNRTGSQKGKMKSKKGTPDSFWVLPNGKYVFAEYTTKSKKDNKAAFIKKLKKDIIKCLSPTETKIPLSKISRLILCFNAEIIPAEIETLKVLVAKSRIKLQIKSLDTIALDIFTRFQPLAKKYLNLSIDTGQVLHPAVFAEEYGDGASLSTPLDNKFFFRQDELVKIGLALRNSNVLILTGPPGIGKSKLALAAMSDWCTSNPGYEAFCISNKYVQIYEDLKSHLKIGKDYILLIDDANRQSQNFLQILAHSKSHKKGNLKIIITVRDYALEFIKSRCNEFDFSVSAIGSFTDDQIEAILKSDDFNVSNPIYLKRILAISKGNPRIAIMAAKLSVKHKKIDVLHDLAEFYDNYFYSFINDDDIFKDQTILKTIGLVSFFYSIDRSDKVFYEKLLSDFGLSHYDFTTAVAHLERLELFESTSDNLIIRISDQVLSAYFFYKVFLKDKILDFTKLLNNYFEAYSNRFRDTIIPATNDFGYSKVLQPIEESLSEYLSKILSDEKKVFRFFDVFWIYLHEEALSFVYGRVMELPVVKVPEYLINKQNQNASWDKDKDLELVSNFYYQPIPEIESAIEITFEYLKRRPHLYQEVYKKLSDIFIFSYEDEQWGFYRQSMLIKVLIANAKKRSLVHLQMFFDLFPVLLRSHFTVHGTSWKRNSVSFYHYNLPASNTVMGLRSKLWKHLQKVYLLDNARASEAIYEYIQPSRDDVQEVLQAELPHLIEVIVSFFKKDKFLDCYFVQKLIERYTRKGLVDEAFNQLKNDFHSNAYKIYKQLDWTRLRNREDSEYQNLDYQKFERLKEIEVRQNLAFSTLSEFLEFYKVFVEVHLSPHIQAWSFNNSLDIILHQMFLVNNSLAIKCLLEIQKRDNKTFYCPYRLFSESGHNLPATRTIFNKIINNELSYQNRHGWIFTFAQSLNSEFVNKEYWKVVLSTYKELSVFSYFEFGYLEKFMKYESKIYHTILRIFIKKAESKINCRLDFNFFEKYLVHFQDDLSLPKKAYFISDQIEQHFDHDCKDFLELLRLDNSFLLEYLEFIGKDNYYVSVRDHTNLSVLWQLPNAEILLKQAFKYFSASKTYSTREHFINSFFQNLSEINKVRAIKFLKEFQKTNAKNLKVSNMIFDIYRHSLKEKYHFAIGEFLKFNSNFEMFKKIELLAGFFSSNGNVIWSDVKAEELQQILSVITKLPKNYLYSMHKAYLKNWIVQEKRSAEMERKRQFMHNDW